MSALGQKRTSKGSSSLSALCHTQKLDRKPVSIAIRFDVWPVSVFQHPTSEPPWIVDQISRKSRVDRRIELMKHDGITDQIAEAVGVVIPVIPSRLQVEEM